MFDNFSLSLTVLLMLFLQQVELSTFQTRVADLKWLIDLSACLSASPLFAAPSALAPLSDCLFFCFLVCLFA